MKTGCLCLRRRRPEEHNSALVWPLQRGKHEETTSITLLMCSLHHSVGLAGQGWLLCFLCRDQDVSSTTAGMLNIFVHFSSPVSKLASVLLNWVFMDILDLLFRSCIQKNNNNKKKQSVSYSKLNASGPCTAGTSTIATGRLDSAVKATKFLSVFLRGFSTPSTIRLCQCTIKRKDKASNSYLNIQKIQAKDMANLRIHIPTRYFLLRLFDVCSWRKIYTAFLKND